MEEIHHETNQIEQCLLSTNDDVRYQLESSYLTDMTRLFPELVWSQVLEKLTDSNDIENCSLSSPFFLKFLRIKRETIVVLPKVFELLMELCNDDNFNEDGDDNTNESIEVGNDVGNDNDSNDPNNSMRCILKCRETCKSWNNAIEGLFEHNDTGHFMLNFEMADFPLLNFTFEDVYSFHPEYPFRDFLQHFDTTHYDCHKQMPRRSPFLGKTVEFFGINVRNQVQQQDHDYINEIAEILQNYGTGIWFVYFEFEVEFGGNVNQFYMLLNQFLKLLPNLKALRLHYNENWDNFNLENIPHGFVEMAARLLRSSEHDALRRRVSQNPFPSSRCLEFIDTKNVPTLVFNELSHKNNKINQLQVHRKDFHFEYGMFSENFPNLTALSLQFRTIADFEKFESCQMPMKLKRFYFWYEESSPFFFWSRLFRALGNKLGESCEELVLQLPMPKNNEEINQVLADSRSCRLNLPNLQRITIFDDMAYCLDFLLPCKMSLELILLRYSNDDDDNAIAHYIRNKELKFPDFEKNQTIKFLGFKEKMEKSNIWREFCKLRKITVHRNREMGGCVTYCGSPKNRGVAKIRKNIWYRD